MTDAVYTRNPLRGIQQKLAYLVLSSVRPAPVLLLLYCDCCLLSCAVCHPGTGSYHERTHTRTILCIIIQVHCARIPGCFCIRINSSSPLVPAAWYPELLLVVREEILVVFTWKTGNLVKRDPLVTTARPTPEISTTCLGINGWYHRYSCYYQ